MFRAWLMTPFWTALMILASGCAQPEPKPVENLCSLGPDDTEVLAEAGTRTATQREFDAELLSIPERARARYENDRGRKDITDRVLLNEALYAEAESKGLLQDPVVRTAARQAAEKAYVNALLKKIEQEAATDEAVQAHYDENASKYKRPMARVRHILVKDKALATSLHEQILGGSDFGELATKHSEDRGSKKRGGELPWATRDRWVKPFADAAFALDVNQISEPVESKFGFHILQLLEKRDMQPMDEVRPGIERVLTRNAVREYREG
ncbi:MAG TPA: hypothetical protein DIU15_10325, partial [Deltaproteobacteria bacterium]|nr:hypothetical protein [Deltaproteobacteria bacterium]